MTDHDLLVAINVKVSRIERELFGNGQSGFDDRLTVVETKVDERTERKRHVYGAGSVGAVLVGVGGLVLRYLGV